MLSSVPASQATLLSSEQRSLAKAFASFTEAAGSLERSYIQLHDEVARLRHELHDANTELQEQRETTRRLEALAEASTVLAHEIRNPLGSLELFAGLLAGSALEDQPAGWVRHIQAGLRTLSATVNNVLWLHHNTAPQLSSLDPLSVVRECVEFLQPLAMQRQVVVVLRSDETAGVIRADRHCMKQVFLNLGLNAFHAMPQGGRLGFSIAGSKSSGWVEISVADTGCGIAAEKLEEIFRPGFTTRPGSVGLGLAVCRKIVEQHGGNIVGRNNAGTGATFTIRLPKAGGS